MKIIRVYFPEEAYENLVGIKVFEVIENGEVKEAFLYDPKILALFPGYMFVDNTFGYQEPVYEIRYERNLSKISPLYYNEQQRRKEEVFRL